jgi:ER membrane protein SH3
MSPILILCGGFLLAVLWMDLMFDVQVLHYRDASCELPEEILSSIAAYYRRVTTLARPMNYAVSGMMLVLVAALLMQIIRGSQQRSVGLLSLPFCGAPILLAGLRVVPNAVRLGSRVDSAAEQSRLARAICSDHLLCLGGIVVFVALQLFAAVR